MNDFIKWISVSARHTAMHMDRVLAPYGLNASQYMYIVEVCAHPGLTQDRFFQIFYIHPSNVTRAIVALEKLGFLERRSNPKDRRTFCVYPTQKALDVYPEITRLRRAWQEEMLAGLAPGTRTELQAALRDAALRAVEQNQKEAPENVD